MAEFCEAIKTFTDIVDGITKVEGVNANTVYDEVEAIQVFIGASGNAQSKNASLMNMFRSVFEEFPNITLIDADTIEIEAKSVVMFSGNDYVIKRNSSAIQIELSADLDTGAEAASTWYYVYLVGDGASTTYTALFSAHATTPTGATYYKLIGKIYNDDASDMTREAVPEGKTAVKLGDWQTTDKDGDAYVSDTSYLADTDGFVIATAEGAASCDCIVYTDSANPPTTIVGRETQGSTDTTERGSISSLVRAGDYWKAVVNGSGTGTIFWIPLI